MPKPPQVLPPPGENPVADQIREAIGAGPEDVVHVTGSPHRREPGRPLPAAPPATLEEWEALRTSPRQALKERGLRCWSGFLSEKGNWVDVEDLPGTPQATHELWVLPGEWYSSVPDGFEGIDIFGEPMHFVRGDTDDGIRLGCLSFGIMVPVEGRTQ